MKDSGLLIAVAKAVRRFADGPNRSYTAKVPGQGYVAEISTGGQLTLKAGSGAISIGVQSYGFGNQRQPVTEPTTKAGTDKDAWPEVRFVRDGISESYVNELGGLHHWLTVSARPSRISGNLWVNLGVNGAQRIKSLSDTAAEVTLGNTKLKYAGLKVWDASGKNLPARMVATATGISLVVSDVTAKYPVTIDPTWDSETKLGPNNFDHLGHLVSPSRWMVTWRRLEMTTGTTQCLDSTKARGNGL